MEKQMPYHFFALLFGLILLAFSSEIVAQKPPLDRKKANTPVVLIHGIGGSDLEVMARGLWRTGFPNDVLKGFPGDPQNLEFDANGGPRSDTISKEIARSDFMTFRGQKI